MGPFDPETGKPLKPSGESFSAVFGHELLDLAQKDDRICAVTAAMVDGTGLTEFAHALPRSAFSMWALPRATRCAMAAGMAKQGMVPVFAVYSTLLAAGL